MKKPGQVWEALPLRGRWALYFVRGVTLLLVLQLAPHWGELREGLPYLGSALPGSLKIERSSGRDVDFTHYGGHCILSTPGYALTWYSRVGGAPWDFLIGLAMDLLLIAAAVILLIWVAELVNRIIEWPLRSPTRS